MPELGKGYSSTLNHGHLSLEIECKNLFAWVDDPLYRYDNFCLTATMAFGAENQYSAAGFLFRRTDDISYYYFLVSNRGHYRLDSVLNGTPSVLIDWTPCPEFNHQKFTLKIFADESSISLYLDDQWLGNTSDDGLVAGGISFAGQNYNESDSASFTLNKIEIESRPVNLEKIREKLSSATVPAESRLSFAESLMKSGQHSSALVEINKILHYESENYNALMMAADCCVSLEMYEEADALLEKLPENEREQRYYLHKAGIYYMTNNFLKLRDFLRKEASMLDDNPAAANLLGNAEFSLGNWKEAAEAYKRAFELDDKQAYYAFNAARALEKAAVGAGDALTEAAEMYGRAAQIYFRTGDYDSLAGLLPYLENMDRDGIETLMLRAKLLFQDGSLKDANKIFTKLIKDKTADSTVYYLNALIEAGEGKQRKASSSFKKAVEIEPDYYLYHFKQAEYLFINGGKYFESLARALELAPEDPWVLNLAGLSALADENIETAIDYFAKASAKAPEEDELTVNYSEALSLSGRRDEALSLLSAKRPMILNQRGNILGRAGEYSLAVKDYEAAFELDRNNPDIILNLAAACIETDAFSRAEELLGRVLDFGENASAYNLMGNLALLKGEYSRAEASYRKAVETEPEYQEAVCNLVEFYISREQLNDADLLLSGYRGSKPGERFEKLKEIVFKKRLNVYNCAVCKHEWVVPKKIGPQAGLRLVGEPPDEMPAGQCSTCGKIYCIGCAKENLDSGRMICMECGTPLKLSDDWMRWLYHQADL